MIKTKTPAPKAKVLATHVAKVRGTGDQARFEQVGVAWEREDGSFYVKFAGTQILTAITLFPVPDKEEGHSTAA